jgi:NAD(P)H-dependent flavin oxidoreductase YrpB (nitropropane dioxygenase family)
MNAPRRILDLFGIEVPIVQAPMLGVTTPEMVAAVAAAGALGSLPLAHLSPEEARRIFSGIRRRTSRPINPMYRGTGNRHLVEALEISSDPPWPEVVLLPQIQDFAHDFA